MLAVGAPSRPGGTTPGERRPGTIRGRAAYLLRERRPRPLGGPAGRVWAEADDDRARTGGVAAGRGGGGHPGADGGVLDRGAGTGPGGEQRDHGGAASGRGHPAAGPRRPARGAPG